MVEPQASFLVFASRNAVETKLADGIVPAKRSGNPLAPPRGSLEFQEFGQESSASPAARRFGTMNHQMSPRCAGDGPFDTPSAVAFAPRRFLPAAVDAQPPFSAGGDHRRLVRRRDSMLLPDGLKGEEWRVGYLPPCASC